MKATILQAPRIIKVNVWFTIDRLAELASRFMGEVVTRHHIMAVASISVSLILLATGSYVCYIFAALFLLLGVVALWNEE